MTWGYFWLFTCKQHCLRKKCSCTTCHGFQSLCKVSSLYLSWFFIYACLNWTRRRRILKTDFFKNIQVPIMPFLGYMLFVTIRISLVCQKLDLIETESEHKNLKCMGIMQYNLCHPYILILSTTVLSDSSRNELYMKQASLLSRCFSFNCIRKTSFWAEFSDPKCG